MDTPRKVLLVDDEPFILKAVAGVLGSGGFEVVTCDQWTGVARAVRAEKPDLVLLDYNMPGLKGDSICSILKRNGAPSGMKVALFSSESPFNLLEVARDCGADALIPKNLPAAEFLRRLELVMASASSVCG